MDCSQFDIHKMHFLDTKKNIIIDGIFTKIVYLDECVSLNAVYIIFPCKCCIDRTPVRNNIMFSVNTQESQDIIKLEENILNAYMKHYQVNNKRMNTNLSMQLMNGRTRLYREGNSGDDSTTHMNPEIILKISGVWENEHEIGITYKFVEMSV